MPQVDDDKFKSCVGHLSQDVKVENIKCESDLKEKLVGHLWHCTVTVVCRYAKLHPSGRVKIKRHGVFAITV